MAKNQNINTIDMKLDTLISYGITLTQKLDRFNQYLAKSNEINKELAETIQVHLAVIKAIGEGTNMIAENIQKTVETNQEVIKVLENVKKLLKEHKH